LETHEYKKIATSITISKDFRWLLMRSDRNLPMSDQKLELGEAADILASEFGSQLTDNLI
jgi:hypothetical protein